MSETESNLRLRPARTEDDAFLLSVYADTRAEELALTQWSDDQRAAFVKMQFDAQRDHYSHHHPEQALEVIELGDKAIGRLWLARKTNEIRILDLTIIPSHRSCGFGTRLLSDLIDEASRTGKELTIYVESYNRSIGLFHRLGFVKTGESGYSHLLSWRKQAS
jgi:ribosomal protein S18 acetylase RimI-like enzyme